MDYFSLQTPPALTQEFKKDVVIPLNFVSNGLCESANF